MNALDLIYSAANDGVYLLRSGDHLRVVGLGTRVMVWASRLRLKKDKWLGMSHPDSSSLNNGLVCAADLDDDLLKSFQERAAITQFYGGLLQDSAERMSAYSVYAPSPAIPTRLHANEPTEENAPHMRKECP